MSDFEIYDEILMNKIDESKILNITNKINEYEQYLKNIYLYLKKFYNIPEVEWIIKSL